MIFLANPNPWLVTPGAPFDAAAAPTTPARDTGKPKDLKEQLEAERIRLGEWQYKLHADGGYAMLIVFQSLDAAGKDGTIRHVFTGVNPTGLHVHSFKRPTPAEVAHDFLWRTARCLPERGHVAIFNRSYYEEVLVVRVHSEFLAAQRQPLPPPLGLWTERLRAIIEHERHLASQGTVILKFWLNVSAEEQRRRLLERIDDSAKNWKFNIGDLDERERRADYLAAYSEALTATSQPWAPWYAVPADDKHFMRLQVASIVNAAFERLQIDFPKPSAATVADFPRARQRLAARSNAKVVDQPRAPKPGRS